MISNNRIELPDSENMNIQSFSRLFDNMSECYKLFWFQAIVYFIIEGKSRMTYNEIINRMIVDAWYMVSEYHLNLGPADTLEALVHEVYQKSGLKSNEKREKILEILQSMDDKEVQKKKLTLTYNVPYRLQAPFIKDVKGNGWNGPKKELADRINQEKRLLYYFVSISGLESEIEIQQNWIRYIQQNQQIIRGWIQYHLMVYLQRRNPSVPGIVNKLNPPQERKLERVKKYWKEMIRLEPFHDIYGDIRLTQQDISIDHFVPWSYVAHDEFWNLHPTTRSINSSKNNSLPDWNCYFMKLCNIEYQALQITKKYPKMRNEFERCLKEHVNNSDVLMKLYQTELSKEEFSNRLEEVISPVYMAAYNMGFGVWKL